MKKPLKSKRPKYPKKQSSLKIDFGNIKFNFPMTGNKNSDELSKILNDLE